MGTPEKGQQAGAAEDGEEAEAPEGVTENPDGEGGGEEGEDRFDDGVVMLASVGNWLQLAKAPSDSHGTVVTSPTQVPPKPVGAGARPLPSAGQSSCQPAIRIPVNRHGVQEQGRSAARDTSQDT